MEAYNRRDLERWIGFCAEDVAVSDLGGLVINSRDAFKEYVRTWFEFSTDARVKVVRSIVEGAHAATELHLTGTHDRGHLYGLLASGIRLEATWAIHVEIANGLVQNLRIFNNPAGYPQQLGLMEAPPVRPD